MTLTIKDKLKKAIEAHRAGQFQEAERLYRNILKAEPDNPDANHNLGILAKHVGKPEAGLLYLKLALEKAPRQAQFWKSYVDTLIGLDYIEEARVVLEQGKRLGIDSKVVNLLEAKIENLRTNSINNQSSAGHLNFKRQTNPTQQQINEVIAAFNARNLVLAEKLSKALVESFPRHPLGYKVLGATAQQLGKANDALSAMRQAIDLKPSDPESHNNLGALLKDIGKLSEAESSCRVAIRLKPDFAEAYSNLGTVLNEFKRYSEAESNCRKAVCLNPKLIEAHNNLGVALAELRRYDEAEASYREAIRLQPNYVEAYSNLGNLLLNLGRLSESVLCYFEAIRLRPNYFEAYNNLGNAYLKQGLPTRAEECYRNAIRLKPDYAEPFSNLCNALREQDRLSEAKMCCEEAIRIKPDFAEAYSNLAGIQMRFGRLSSAEGLCREAIRLNPNEIGFRNNLLFAINYDEKKTACEVYREYESFSNVMGSKNYKHFEHSIRKNNEPRRLRIGYASPDFQGHSCLFFMEPLFRHHDRSAFELYAYSNTPRPDTHTERLQNFFDHWVDVRQLNDEEMAERIFHDDIDVLVDLAGHTGGNRLSSFLMRPAKVQVSYLGYGYTTGLKEIDYFIGDENLTPTGSDAYFSEKIYRLNRPAFCYQPPAEAMLEVSELPAFKKGYITFGSLSRMIRFNDRVLKAWAQILEQVPGSRLRLDQRPFADEATRREFYARLQSLGFRIDRVDLTCTAPHWNAYHDIDITLDCFPHNAGTTTFESIWMGVPVLSKLDRPSVGRFGACILNPLGLSAWVAESEEEYINRAVGFASDLEALANVRTGLRSRLQASHLMNAEGMARALENAFRSMCAIG